MSTESISCTNSGCNSVINISNKNSIEYLFSRLTNLFRLSILAGDSAAQYWADIATSSEHPLAPLAHIPRVFAALWTPNTAPSTAITLGTSSFGFFGLPKHLVHFTTIQGARGIATASSVNATRIGLFGPGVYMAKTGRPVNLFIQSTAKIPIYLPTPRGTVRIVPYLVYVRWGLSPIKIP